MIILGIDPGSRATGLGLVRFRGSQLSHLASEVIRAPRGSDAQRLAHIQEVIEARIALWRPDAAALEGAFSARNSRSALQLGQARGVALAACGRGSLPCAEYAPAEVKAAVAGTGSASKSQVQAMVQRLLALPGPPAADAADALAVAICHGHGAASPGAARIARAVGARTSGPGARTSAGPRART